MELPKENTGFPDVDDRGSCWVTDAEAATLASGTAVCEPEKGEALCVPVSWPLWLPFHANPNAPPGPDPPTEAADAFVIGVGLCWGTELPGILKDGTLAT
jgi:hypothetical protein